MTEHGEAARDRSGRPPPAPLSSVQQRLWFVQQLEPDSAAYNTPRAVRICGRLEVGVLERVLDEIVRRHESLRTCFPLADGLPVQLVTPAEPRALPIVELRGERRPGAARDDRVGEWAAAFARPPFDLTRGPPMRAALVRLGPDEHVLVLVAHHLVFDGWSMKVLLEEMAALYAAFAAGRPSPLPELPMQYADYARRQQEQRRPEAIERDLAYWRERMRGAPAVLELPTDRPRPAARSVRGAKQTIVLSPELAAGLKAVSRREGATLFMTLLAAFDVLLLRYTGEEDIVVGCPIAGRTRAELEQLVGCFINTLALRTDLAGDPPFRELLARVRTGALEAYVHQELPLDRLVDALRPARRLGRHPLFDILLNFRNFPERTIEVPGLELGEVAIDPRTTPVDLAMEIAERPGGLSCGVQYSTDLFDAATIGRMLGHYRELLAGIVAAPDRRLSELPLLTAAERRQVLVSWNETATDLPRERCIHELVEAQAARTPRARAVSCAGRTLTYEELDARANQLAHHLRARGVGPEVRVGLCAERSLELAVGTLAILKAGGAYVPLDPAYPPERLSFMVADARTPVLVTQERLLSRLPAHGGAVVCLDADWSDIAREPPEKPAVAVTPDNLAYVMYTSGSTGRPKGVMIGHRGVCNFLHWRQTFFPLAAADRQLHSASVCFDDSVWQLFEPLMVGAESVMTGEGERHDGDHLVRLIAGQRITSASFVPSMLRALLDDPRVDACRDLRRLSTGGEVLAVDLQEHCLARLSAALYNGYGPTEATVAVTFWRCTPGSAERTVPIGRPIANTQVLLLDRHLQPVPIGVPGELYIGGAGLARGYLDRPALTAERFLPHPFSTAPGARLYRTGDLARFRPDGNIEFLGRVDQQVKLRGYRIEPGEIEAVLVRHPDVRAAVVAAREHAPGDVRLVAYVVTAPEREPSARELQRFLEERIPDYMVPWAFVALDALPRTPTGKIDLRSLPEAEASRLLPDARYVAPRTPVERTLAAIWAEVLRVERVGVHDDFFDLGGHSLLATQVMSRVRSAFEVELPLRALFDGPTVAELAERLR